MSTASLPNSSGERITELFMAHRAFLLKIATLQLRKKELAEEVVQETYLAVLEHPDRFRGESSWRTYLVAILKRKIIDILRAKESVLILDWVQEEAQFEQHFEALLQTIFEENGHWTEEGRPKPEATPEEAWNKKRFWLVLEACVGALPPKTSFVFIQREVMGEAIEDIGRHLSINVGHVSVLLYRARSALRQCLEAKGWQDAQQFTA